MFACQSLIRYGNSGDIALIMMLTVDKSDQNLEAKLLGLRDVLSRTANHGRLSIAYSGGLDSRFLAFFAARNGFDVELLHASAAHVSQAETSDAVRRAQDMGLTVRVVYPQLPSPQQLAQAGRDRCYVCKRAIFTALLAEAAAPLCDGSNASDTLVFRPGSRAIRELGVHTPLADAGLTKPQIRTAATKLGLADPQQPARPCLLTRFDYGDAPDEKRLQLTQQAEEFLSGLPQLSAGFRVRWLGQRPLLHVSAANALTDKDLSSICEQLTEKIPELRGVQAEVMENLSGWFDRKVDDLSR